MYGRRIRMLVAVFAVTMAGAAFAAPASASIWDLIKWPSPVNAGDSGGWQSLFWPWQGENPDQYELAPAAPDEQTVLEPSGEPRGALIAIHGGGWIGSRDYVKTTSHLAGGFTDRGWRVHVVGYSSGGAALADLERWYRKVRAATPAIKPVCAWGMSAGAHLALLLANRVDLDCVIAEAGPTYLPDLDEHWDLPGWVDDLSLDAFGSDLRAHSPLVTNRTLRTPTLLGHAKQDTIVPFGQSRAYAKQIAKTELVGLAKGDGKGYFVHTKGVDSEDFDRYQDAVTTTLKKAVRRLRVADLSRKAEAAAKDSKKKKKKRKRKR